MSLAKEIDLFFRNTNQEIFIEVEGKPDTIRKFISEYNASYSPSITPNDSGIIKLEEDANKWGLELRCYFNDITGFPDSSIVTGNRAYRPEYSYRFNDVRLIKELFELGYRIGRN